MWKLFDFVCICGVECERLVESDEAALCPFCMAPMTRQLFTQGSAARAMVDPVKTRENASKARHMQLRVTGQLPWRKNSYSQTSND